MERPPMDRSLPHQFCCNVFSVGFSLPHLASLTLTTVSKAAVVFYYSTPAPHVQLMTVRIVTSTRRINRTHNLFLIPAGTIAASLKMKINYTDTRAPSISGCRFSGSECSPCFVYNLPFDRLWGHCDPRCDLHSFSKPFIADAP